MGQASRYTERKLRGYVALLRILSAVLGITNILAAYAQSSGNSPSQVEIAMRAQANAGTERAWLEGNDPRLIAWGAHFASEDDDRENLQVAAMLVRRSLFQGGPGLFEEDRPHREALGAVLDAVIVRKVPLDAEMVGYVYRSYPFQAAILAARLPVAEREPLLWQWYGGGSVTSSPTLARIAAMLLAQAPPLRFTASLLRNAEEKLTISIVADKRIVPFSGAVAGGSCEDDLPSSSQAGWPDRIYYRLFENDRTGAKSLLVEVGGDRITWERARGGLFRSCGGVGALTAEMRHHLLAAMLGERDDAMLWAAGRSVIIERHTEEQVEREIGRTILAERAALNGSVGEFASRGLLTAEEAKTALPKLSVEIVDQSTGDPPK